MSEPIAPSGPTWGQDPKAQAKAEKAYRKAQRPFYKKKRYILLGLVVLLIAAISIGSAGGSKKKDDTSTTASAPKAVTSNNDDAAKNITVTDCKVDDLGGSKVATIGYTVNNPTSKSSTYLLAINVTDSTGARVSEANGIEANVLPGQPSQGQAIGNVSDSAAAPYTCTVGKVTRTAAN